MKSNEDTLQWLPVVFVSLGGTKLQISAISNDSQVLSDVPIHWRSVPEFRVCLEQEAVTGFCDTLARWVHRFLENRGRTWADVGLIGVGLPGPCMGGLWHSFNLTKAFEHGVQLDAEFSRAVEALHGSCPPVRVAFDAQCDAGGELYHPLGRLNEWHRASCVGGATVINVATGIAAGFIKQGRVLLTDEDFASEIDARYDGGAGQIGRHLWQHSENGEWRYHYAPSGGIPYVVGAARMTELLSGPALAARLLWLLGHNKCLPQRRDWTASLVTVEEIWEMWDELREEADITKRSQRMRRCAKPLSTAILAWADKSYASDHSAEGAPFILAKFARDIAGEFASAICAWAAVPGWKPLLQRVILTGGVGIYLLASADFDSGRSFCAMLNNALPQGITAQRSRLSDSAERGAYLFLRQYEMTAQRIITK